MRNNCSYFTVNRIVQKHSVVNGIAFVWRFFFHFINMVIHTWKNFLWQLNTFLFTIISKWIDTLRCVTHNLMSFYFTKSANCPEKRVMIFFGGTSVHRYPYHALLRNFDMPIYSNLHRKQFRCQRLFKYDNRHWDYRYTILFSTNVTMNPIKGTHHIKVHSSQ